MKRLVTPCLRPQVVWEQLPQQQQQEQHNGSNINSMALTAGGAAARRCCLQFSVRSLSQATLMKPRVRIVEVGPRDGLQNEKTIVPTDVKESEEGTLAKQNCSGSHSSLQLPRNLRLTFSRKHRAENEKKHTAVICGTQLFPYYIYNYS